MSLFAFPPFGKAKVVPHARRPVAPLGLFPLLLLLLFPLILHAQSQERALIEAIRSGNLKVTDQMIEEQRRQHPELRKLSNAQIRAKLDSVKNAEDYPVSSRRPKVDSVRPTVSDTTDPTVALDTNGEGSSRFPRNIPRFGFDFFTRNAGMADVGQMASLPDYQLSPGDELILYTWGRENQRQSVFIDNEGMVHVPPLEPMRLAGMKFEEAQKTLVREMERIHGVKASVAMGRMKSIQVFVLGEVNKPGAYVVPAGATVTTALFQSGGIKEIGSLRNIQLKRAGRVVAGLDLYDMLLHGSKREDRQLLPGDVIFIPVAPAQVAVTGMVKRPGVYEVRPGTKVLSALELSGGLTSNAYKGRVRLDRIDRNNHKVVLDVHLDKMDQKANVVLQDGDILFVDEVLTQEFDVVYLRGNVNRPGRFEFKTGMTVKDLIPSHRDLKAETFFRYGHIKRSSEVDERALLIPFSLAEVLDQGSAVPLMPRDTVIIYSRYDLMDQPKVKVAGVVRKPGEYNFVDQMRVSDLIIAGGGLTMGAYLPEAHLLRVLKIQDSEAFFSTLLKVNLTNLMDNPGDENNVVLMPYDSLIVFPRENFMQPKSVRIVGAVKTPGKYELTENLGIQELVSQANGLTKGAFRLRVEVVRRVIENDSVVNRNIHHVNMAELIERGDRFELQDGDAVYLREIVDYRESAVVYMTGEFNFPGKYEVANGERLSNVIERAGGFTDAAYLRGTVFIRQRVKDQQLAHIEEISRKLEEQMHNMLTQTTNENDRASIMLAVNTRKSLLEEIKEAPYLGRVVIDLDRKMKFRGGDFDITIEDGDSLFIGAYPNTISIMGEVFSPTTVVHSKQTNTVGKALAKAGGATQYGDKGQIYYVKPDGSILTPQNTWFFGSRGVEAGGSIIVPPKGPKKDYLDALSKITQIIYQTAIAVGVAVTVF